MITILIRVDKFHCLLQNVSLRSGGTALVEQFLKDVELEHMLQRNTGYPSLQTDTTIR